MRNGFSLADRALLARIGKSEPLGRMETASCALPIRRISSSTALSTAWPMAAREARAFLAAVVTV